METQATLSDQPTPLELAQGRMVSATAAYRFAMLNLALCNGELLLANRDEIAGLHATYPEDELIAKTLIKAEEDYCYWEEKFPHCRNADGTIKKMFPDEPKKATA